MALFSRKNISSNPFGLTKDDLKGDIKNFPMGVVVRMMEETERQGNKPDVKVFQKYMREGAFNGGFDWNLTEAGTEFWVIVTGGYWKKFFERYPDYARYNLA